MKKYFLLGLIVAIAPGICLGAGARYTQLVREKQRKMAELEKCMGATNGLKIAGISTLGLTAVGVAGNIAEAKKRDEYDANIKKAESEISNFDKEIAAEQKKIDDKKAEAKRIAEEEEKAKAEGRAALSKASYAINCRLSGGTPLGDDKCMCKLGKKPDSTGKCGLDTEEKIQVISQQPTVKGPELTDVVSGNNNFMGNPVGTGDTTATSDSPTPVSTNSNLSTSQSESSSVKKENCEHDDLGKWENGKCTCTDNYVLHTSGFCVASFTSEQKCVMSDGDWVDGKCKCPSKHKLLSDGVCHSIGQVAITATPSDTNDNTVATVDNNNSGSNTVKNVVARDIAAINATPASLGAKIYVSGYNIDQLPEDLYDDIYSAMEEFTSKCDENEGWFGDYPDDRSWGSNYANTSKLNPDDVWEYTERYVLAQCVQN